MMRKLGQFIAAAALTAFASVSVAGLPVYRTSFESSESFAVGDYMQGQSIADSWSVLTGSVSVVSDGSGAVEGDQYLSLSANTQLDRDFTSMDLTGTVWVEGYFRGRGSSVKLGDPQGPVYPTDSASAIVHFSEEVGVQMYDGDGQGDLAEAVNSDVALGTGNMDTWRKVTIQLDFAAKVWNLWIDDVKKSPRDLGFRNNNVNSLRGFRNLAQDAADFDSFRVVLPVPGDANGDGTADSADLIRLYEYIANGLADPILLFDSDLDSTPGVGEGDVMALLNLLIS